MFCETTGSLGNASRPGLSMDALSHQLTTFVRSDMSCLTATVKISLDLSQTLRAFVRIR